MSPNVPSHISILWKGVIAKTCRVMLFIDERAPQVVSYTLIDDPKLLGNKWVENFKLIQYSGEFLISGAHTPAENVDNMVSMLNTQYSELTAQVYMEELSHGLYH